MKSLRWLLALFGVEGLLAVLWIFLTPSENGSAIILWLSRGRLLLLGFALALWAMILAAGIASWRRPPSLAFMQARLDRFCLDEEQLGSLLIFLSIVPLLLLAGTLGVALTPLEYDAYRSWAPDTFPLLHSLVGATLPLLLLIILMVLESAIYLGVHYRSALTNPAQWSLAHIATSSLVLLIGILTIFYWLVLIFQLRFFVNNPAWYWKFAPVPFTVGDALYAFGVLVLSALTGWILFIRRQNLAGLILLFALGWFLQVGVGVMAGGGFAAFRERYFSTYHKTYISKASTGQAGVADSVRQYEQLYGSRAFTNTKPPGLMAFYIGLDHLLNGHPSVVSDESRFERLASLVSYAFPLVAMLMVFALYTFARRFVQGPSSRVAVLAPFLLILCPNLVLFSLFPDQAIYPLVYILGASLIIVAIQRGSLILAFIVGLFLYGAVFFAFTILPLYPFAGIYLALHYWMSRNERSLRQQVLIALAIAGGSLLLYLLFHIFLNYDFVPRFAKTIAINHNFDFYLRVGRVPPVDAESFLTRATQIFGAAWLNNLDFAAGIGFPIYILFAVQSTRLLKRLFKGIASPGDLILASLLLSFIVLNLAGTAQGEVPRLWLFWLPMVVILAARELEPLLEAHPLRLSWLAAAQFVTIFLTFHFQDLKM